MFDTDKDEALSRDIGALQKVIKISIPTIALKWEIFGTPEDKGGGAPGPTTYMTLVAEVEPTNFDWFAQLKENAEKEWIAPESARPWLSPFFETLLKESRTDKSKLRHCKKYQVELTKTGKLVNGFACQHEGSLLIHVKLLGPAFRDLNPDGPPIFE